MQAIAPQQPPSLQLDAMMRQLMELLRHHQVCLIIADNGRGFHVDQAMDGFGLQGMQERIAALDGNFTLATEPGQGCQIQVDIPLFEVSS